MICRISGLPALQSGHVLADCIDKPILGTYFPCTAIVHPALYEWEPAQGIVPRMRFGRLIRVRAHRHDPAATIYVVAEAEVEKAIQILKIALVRPQDEYEDLGRVTDTLLNALSLQPGQFART